MRAHRELGVLKCDELYSLNTVSHSDCLLEADKKFNEIFPPMQHDMILIVLIPTLFFGGTWIFKYLFPRKDN